MKRIGIICGGYSSEFEISVKSASTILNHFPHGYDAFLILVEKDKWTAKYKNSINCSNPKGFSQKAHCQGRKKK